MKKRILLTIVSLLLIVVTLATTAFLHRTEYLRETDPTGRYTAIFSYRTYLSYLPMPPGSASDKPCFVKIVDAGGRNMGEVPVPMMQMAAIEWTEDGALVANGVWDFNKKTCEY